MIRVWNFNIKILRYREADRGGSYEYY